MNKISTLCAFAIVFITLTACDMPKPPSQQQIINKAKSIIIQNHRVKNITKTQIKRENDGYEIDIVADGDIYEVDCTTWGICEED